MLSRIMPIIYSIKIKKLQKNIIMTDEQFNILKKRLAEEYGLYHDMKSRQWIAKDQEKYIEFLLKWG